MFGRRAWARARANMEEKEVCSVWARDKTFCEEYIIDFNAKAAALRAGFKETTAADAWQWIRDEAPAKPEVKAYINKLIAERSKRTGITADRVLQELARIAFADIADAIDLEKGIVRKDASKDDRAAIASVKIKKGRISEREVRMHDKVHALELLGKHMGMLKDNIQITGALPVVIDDVPELPAEESKAGSDGNG